ncbi:ribonuclease T2 [Sulfitobacter sp. G21635-S1]|uniref:ribonuclease T2 n=1 Tax=Sulfitobacter sp. G21635-S1 TaxID=3014043 RepID=UPI0022AF1278|nr:ribonuclease T2 [Sulfitobacter sp. G21635-S1]MCZ4256366.1 ribonuclease T2 [Sulfitobacter sp. G21635-S1]
MRALALILALLCSATALRAGGQRAGEFDYYVLALSWSPNWCALEGDARRSPQCARDAGHGWVLHGLWPQFHRGYPAFCQTAQRPPSRGMTAAMADIMGTGGLAWHQWKKHGSCSGLSAADYYALSRQAYGTIRQPEVFRKLSRDVRLPASVVEAAFLKANPGLEPDGITITCRDGHIQEARICLSKTLDPVPCGQDVVKDCRMKDALFTHMRNIP